MYICWYLKCCFRTSVILKSLPKSSSNLCRASLISFNFCLFTWAAYPVTFKIEMTWTRVSCCLLFACVNWFTCYFISHVSLVVAVSDSHFNTSPGKGNRLLLDHWLSESALSNPHCRFYDGPVGLIDIVYGSKFIHTSINYKLRCQQLVLEFHQQLMR